MKGPCCAICKVGSINCDGNGWNPFKNLLTCFWITSTASSTTAAPRYVSEWWKPSTATSKPFLEGAVVTRISAIYCSRPNAWRSPRPNSSFFRKPPKMRVSTNSCAEPFFWHFVVLFSPFFKRDFRLKKRTKCPSWPSQALRRPRCQGRAVLALPQYLGALAEHSCDHQFRCGCCGPCEIYSRAMNSLPHRNCRSVDTFSETRQTWSGFSRRERLGIPNSGAPQTISPTLTEEEDRGLREENGLCWLGREGRQQPHSTPLRQSRENLDQAFSRPLLPTRIGEHLQSDGQYAENLAGSVARLTPLLFKVGAELFGERICP